MDSSAPDPTAPSAGASERSTWLRRLPTAAAVLICVLLLNWSGSSVDGFIDSDSYFHTRAARELDRDGLKRTFPEAVHSTWSERYSNKDFLFHVALIPFQRVHRALSGGGGSEAHAEDLVTPGKQAVLALQLLLFATLALSLHRIGARAAAYWLALYFCTDISILGVLLPVRPELLGLPLLVFEAVLILRGKWVALLILGVLHVWAHTSFVLLPGIGFAWAVARLLRGESLPWKVVAACVGAPVLGTLVHPYAPNNLFLLWDQVIEVARGVWVGSEIPQDLFGPELLPVTTNRFLVLAVAYIPAVAALAALLAWPSRRLSTDGLALAFMAGLLLLASFLSARFLTYFVPFAILFGARAWAELLEPSAPDEPGAKTFLRKPVVLGLFALLPLAGLAKGGVWTLRERARQLATVGAQAEAVEFLRKSTEPEDFVFHNFWWDFSILYHYRPEGRYVVGLDPVFFQRHDPELFQACIQIHRGRATNLYELLQERFGANWVFVSKQPNNAGLYELVRRDARFQVVYEDAHALVAWAL